MKIKIGTNLHQPEALLETRGPIECSDVHDSIGIKTKSGLFKVIQHESGLEVYQEDGDTGYVCVWSSHGPSRKGAFLGSGR
jgi:hypothetical protein